MTRKIAELVLSLGLLAGSAAAATPAAAGTTLACSRNITVHRYTGSAAATWTCKDAHSAQVFADWAGRTMWGAKSTGAASVVDQPASVNPLEKPDCAGYATYSSTGRQTSRVDTYGSC